MPSAHTAMMRKSYIFILIWATVLARATCDTASTLQFRPDGSFKLLQIADLHYGEDTDLNEATDEVNYVPHMHAPLHRLLCCPKLLTTVLADTGPAQPAASRAAGSGGSVRRHGERVCVGWNGGLVCSQVRAPFMRRR